MMNSFSSFSINSKDKKNLLKKLLWCEICLRNWRRLNKEEALWQLINWTNIKITYAWQLNYLGCNNECRFAREYKKNPSSIFFSTPNKQLRKNLVSISLKDQQMAPKSGIDFEIAQFIVRYTPAYGDEALRICIYLPLNGFSWLSVQQAKHTFYHRLLITKSVEIQSADLIHPYSWVLQYHCLSILKVSCTKPWKQWQIIREIHCRHRFLESHQVRVGFKVSV